MPGEASSPAQGLEDLSVDECLELLERSYLGRLAFVRDGVPQMLPVNYRFHEGSVVFRTGYGTLLDTVHLSRVAFEIDALDPATHSGWSVVVHGKAQEVTDPAELERLRELPLRPWAPGARDHYVRILGSAITGRRIG